MRVREVTGRSRRYRDSRRVLGSGLSVATRGVAAAVLAVALLGACARGQGPGPSDADSAAATTTSAALPSTQRTDQGASDTVPSTTTLRAASPPPASPTSAPASGSAEPTKPAATSEEELQKPYADYSGLRPVTLGEARAWYAPQVVLEFDASDTKGRTVARFVKDGDGGRLETLAVPDGFAPETSTEDELLTSGTYELFQFSSTSNLDYTMPGTTPVLIRGNKGQKFVGRTGGGAAACHIIWTERGTNAKFVVLWVRSSPTACDGDTLVAVANRLK